MRALFLLLLSVIYLEGTSQSYNPLTPPNTYPAKDNPQYWKNRPPFPGYWQQDVHYIIEAKIDETTDIITATEQLKYTNNSPDTLAFVFFHLYQEAFQPGSYADKLNLANHHQQPYGPYEKEGLGTKVDFIKINGNQLKTETDNTVMKVYLPSPLLPGQSITFDLAFKTYFDNSNGVGRRMKKFHAGKFKHYDGVHWYPRIAVYDRKFGWCTDQHLGKEFYGDFGCFDVSLEFASNYIVEATGNMLNRDEMLPADLRAKLDIKNFTQPVGKISEIIPYIPTERKNWKFHAENVHDFAFTADPSYRIGETSWNGIKIISLARENHAHVWQNAAEYTAKVIETYSRDFGMYVYHKMVVADANDGMEYPMLTLDGGGEPGYRGLLAHEVGHNWFFGQVGNNETYRAALDEGFTQFLTSWSLEHIDGDTMVTAPAGNWYEKMFEEPKLVRENSVYTRYIIDAAKGEDAFLNTHSDDFNSALGHGGGYRQVYYKTATMLYNLQYVLGDELFSKAMKHYFSQWKIAHPYFEDFRNSIIQFTKVDLNWFFDQWMETKKTIDYSVVSARYGDAENEYLIKFRRKGEMQMPVDFDVIGENDSVYHFHIPNNWFVKETKATVLPRWIGWGKLNEEYVAKVILPNGVKDVIIDPSNRLADVNQLNNSLHFPIVYRFDSRLAKLPDIHRYEVNIRPEVWYNGYDGVKAGFHLNGNYLNYKHIFDVTFWINTGFAQRIPDYIQNYDGVNNEFNPVAFRLNYSTTLGKGTGRPEFFVNLKSMEGLQGGQIGLRRTSPNGKFQVYSYYKMMYRKDSSDLYYLLYPTEWIADKFNNTINAGINKMYSYRGGTGFINFHLKSAAIGSDYSFSQLSMTSIHRTKIWRMKLNTRIFAQYGTGNNIPKESAMFFAGANPEDMMDNKYTRSIGFFDYNWNRKLRFLLQSFSIWRRIKSAGIQWLSYSGIRQPWKYYLSLCR